MKKLITILFVCLLPFLPMAQTTYYVSTTGNDANSGSSGSPFASLSHACSVAITGDNIHVNSGNYTEVNKCTLAVGVSIQGDSLSNPHIKIHYVVSWPHDYPNEGAISLVSATQGTSGNQTISNIIFDGDNLYATSCIAIIRRGNVTLRNLTVKDFYINGVLLIGAANAYTKPVTWSANNQIYNCTMTNCGDSDATWVGGGIINQGGQLNLSIHDNYFANIYRTGWSNGDIVIGNRYGLGFHYYNNISYKPSGADYGWNFHLEIPSESGGCEIFNNQFHGGDQVLDLGDNFTNGDSTRHDYGYQYTYWVHDNYFEDDGGLNGLGTHGKACISIEGNLSENILINNNTFNHIVTVLGITQYDSVNSFTRNIVFRNNVGVNCGSVYPSNPYCEIISISRSQGDAVVNGISIINNSITASDSTIASAIHITTSTNYPFGNIPIANNIFTNMKNGTWLQVTSTAGTVDSLMLRNNLFHNNASNTPTFSGNPVTNYINSGNFDADPLFVSSTDLHLQAGSPAIGAAYPYGYGNDIGALQTALPPTIAISANQTITVSNTSVSAVGTAASGETITGYAWTVSSGTGTFGSPTSASTTVTGLSSGANILRCTVAQTDGQTAYKEVTVTVNLVGVRYYISNAGNDSNDGLTTATSWQTLGKVNATTFNPGDSVLFKKGDTFYGSLTVSDSGTIGSPITFGAYGAGAQPIITGFTSVTAWTNLGSNIWESTNAVSTLSDMNLVSIGGTNTAMGRYPNTGYLTFQSHSSNTSITSSSLTGTPNWTGAEAVIRSTQWSLERKVITSQSGGTLNYSASIYTPADGFGFFIQNDARTLDAQNEWYYNPSTKKLSVYSSASSTNVQAATINTLVTVHGSYISFSGLSFQGANEYAFFNDWDINHVTIDNCNISFSGIDGIKMADCHYCSVTNSVVSNSNNTGINFFYDDLYATVTGNTINNSGIHSGMGASGAITYNGVNCPNTGLIATNNTVTNSGYCGIYFSGDSSLVQNNYVDSFCTVIQDGGGIYTINNTDIFRKIIGNIILNGIGISDGTNNPSYLAANGIYLDDNSANIEVTDNSVANCSNIGIFLHNAHDLNIQGNTFYNNRAQFGTQHDSVQDVISGVTVKNNLFIARESTQWASEFKNYENSSMPSGTLDSNYYTRPIDDNLTFDIITSSGSTPISLATWQSTYSTDLHSKKSSQAITSIDKLIFEYNATQSNSTVSLGQNYVDVKGDTYSGSITLTPFASAVLIAVDAPTANAGTDQTITLPTSSANLSGSGTVASGQTASYLWTKVSGSGTQTITGNTTLTPTVSGMTTSGDYVFQLKVTQTDNQFATSTVTIHVNPSVTPQQPFVLFPVPIKVIQLR